MTGHELLHLIESKRKESHRFIKWWRNNDNVNRIELLDTFYDTAKVGAQFDGFELLDMEEMWAIVKRNSYEKVMRAHANDEEIIIWERVDPAGSKRNIKCKFVPESLIRILAEYDINT